MFYIHTHTLNSIETIKCGEIKKQEAKNSYLTSFFFNFIFIQETRNKNSFQTYFVSNF